MLKLSNTQNKYGFKFFNEMKVISNFWILGKMYAFRNGPNYPVFPYVKFN